MSSIECSAASSSVSDHIGATGTPVGFGETFESTTPYAGGSADDYKILRPGDFRRPKSQLKLRSALSSRDTHDSGSEASDRTASTSAPISANGHIRDTSPLPPDFDLVIKSPRNLAERQGGDRATFGTQDPDSDGSDAGDDIAMPSELNEEFATVDEHLGPKGGTFAHDMHSKKLCAATSSPRTHDAHLDQLKQEADQLWATYRPGKTPQHAWSASDHSLNSIIATSGQPAHNPHRITSLRRSAAVVLDAVPTRDSKLLRNSVATNSSQSQKSAALSLGGSPVDVLTFPRVTASSSHGSAPLYRGPASSDLHFHRPYTASIVSSASDGSFLSYQQSFESGTSPLLVHRSGTSSRVPSRMLRPATSGSIPNARVGASDFEHSHLMLSAATARPETSNRLTSEQRWQQVRRTKKLTQLLGEEMLLASNATHSEAASHNMRVKHRPQSMPFTAESAVHTSALTTTAGHKTRTLSRKLLRNRNHGVKSLDRASSDMMMQPPASAPASLNRKAAAVLGIAHPYSSGAFARPSAEEMLASDGEMDRISDLQPRAFIPSGLEEFNQPTPKVAQLAAFSAAALDEGASPTLPQDGPFETFDRSHLDHALAISESRKLAAARDERRRRVAKMSRWLGEAVPAELISSGARQLPSAVIRSTEPALDSSSLGHDSAAYTSSELSNPRRGLPSSIASTACNSSALDHGSVSHEGSTGSNLHSFMSIDSSEDEADGEVPATVNRIAGRPRGPLAASHRSVTSSPRSVASALPDRISAYRTSIDSWEYLLDTNDHERLTELASIFHNTRLAPKAAISKTMSSIVRSPHSLDRPASSPAAPSMVPTSAALFECSISRASQSEMLHCSVGAIPRRSAAFLELSDSESDSTEADDELQDIDHLSPYYSATLRQKRIDSQDRSISKLSNFFGSTPSQIVQSQSDIHSGAIATSSGDCIDMIDDQNARRFQPFKAKGNRISQPDALKTMLRSLQEEALDDSELTNVQKSEILRKVQMLKKRTTSMFA